MDNSRSASRLATARLRTGAKGERIAAAYLRLCGYSIVATNVHVHPHDEIDIVAYDPKDRVLTFCEVKSRSRAHADFDPALDMTWRKRRAVTRAARSWIRDRRWEGGYRIDLICVAQNRVIRHVREIETAENAA